MVSDELLEILRCPTCGETGPLASQSEGLRCLHCGEHYPLHSGYVDLMPRRIAFDHVSDYVAEEEAFAEVLDYRSVGPPLLAAGVRQWVLRRMLNLQPTDRVLDCGCGNAKFALWNREAVALMVGLDPATLFANEALAQVDLVRGDARRTPFIDAAFDKAFSIDLFEHLTRADLEAVLSEMHRLLQPGGWLLVYSNTREPSTLQSVVDMWRHVGRWLRRRGLAAPDYDALRKADHVKVLATYEEVADFVTGRGFRIVAVQFWNSVITSFVDHVLMPLLERRRASVSSPGAAPSPPLRDGEKGAPTASRRHWRRRLQGGGPLYWAARALTAVMSLDLILFGGLRSGSYFLLLERI